MTTRCRDRSVSGFSTAVFLVSVVLAGCASNSAPPGWLDAPEPNQDFAYGGWVEVRYLDHAAERRTAGELIAVSSDSIYVLPGDGLTAIGRHAVVGVRLTGYDSDAENIASWTAVMAASSVSHGLGAIGTVPAWILVGSLLTAATSHGPVIESNGESRPGETPPHSPPGTPPARADGFVARPTGQDSWDRLPLYARFPQGLPPAVDRAALQPKPLPSTAPPPGSWSP